LGRKGVLRRHRRSRIGEVAGVVHVRRELTEDAPNLPAQSSATDRKEQSHGIGLAPDTPPLRLMADKNSWRVAALVRKLPSMQLVTIVTSGLCTPLVVMHSCAASTTTPTPNGLSTLSRPAANPAATLFSPLTP